MAVSVARVMPFDTRSGRRSYTVTSADGLPVGDIELYLAMLRALGRSANTVKSYAHHLSLFWRWLHARQLQWEQASFTDLSEFLLTYRRGIYPLEREGGGERTESSARAVAAALKEFYEYHRLEGRGPERLDLTRAAARSSRTKHKFLAHIEQRKPALQNRLLSGVNALAQLPPIINFEEDFALLLNAAESHRDRFLLSSMFDGGIRIGQALGLRHGDLDIPNKRIVIQRRDNNVNGALSKTPDLFEVKMPRRFFDLYSKYLLEDLVRREIESDYLFVNLVREPCGAPCSYSNTYQQIRALGARAGIVLTPHTLRHTHATALAKAGWTNAEIAARLGQRHPSSADIYIHLANSDLEDRMNQTSHLIWPGSVQYAE